MKEQLQKYGFMVVKNLYDVKNHTKRIPDLFQYTKEIKNKGEFDAQTPFAPSFHSNIEMCKVQIKVLTKLEEITDLKLYPTYTYFRIYNKKSILKRHSDRPACQVSLTMNIGYEGDYNWAIWIKDNFGKEHEVFLEPGDALVYMGCNNEHWREDADERVICQSQVFMHYVIQDSEYEDQIYDLITERGMSIDEI